MRRRYRQSGLTTVEFALIGAVALTVLFAVVEVGRMFFVINALNEVTRRSARVAAVCPIGDPAIREVALFNAPGAGTGSRFIYGLTPEHVAVEYLTRNGDPITDPEANFGQIQYVRTRVVGYQHQMLIPFASYLFATPEFATTLRRESLGVPRQGTVEPC
jgi:hypothetical protein